jgi:hypothetical protein
MSEKQGDIVYTPDWVAEDMLAHFRPFGTILDPCRGEGAFHKLLPDGSPWCEISEAVDFFDWTTPVDWVISNPPYSMTRAWFRHSYTIAENLLYLIPLRNLFSGYGFVREVYEFGGIAGMRVYGTGGRLGFPMGNAVGAVHVVRDYPGPADVTLFDSPAHLEPGSRQDMAAHAWEQGRRAERRDWEFTADLATPDEDRQPWLNPYRYEVAK